MDTIKQLNNLTSDNLSIGQQLLIPVSDGNQPPTTITYTVVAGDTLWRLALRFHTTVNTIKQLNNLTSDNLSIGQQLLIPVSDGNQPPTTITYTAVAGDTLWELAQRFHTAVEAIEQFNDLTSDKLQIEQ